MSSHDDVARGEQYLEALRHTPTRTLVRLVLNDERAGMSLSKRPTFPFAHTLHQMVTQVVAGGDVDARKLGAVLNFHSDRESRKAAEIREILDADCVDDADNVGTRPPVDHLAQIDQNADGLISTDGLIAIVLALANPRTGVLREIGQEPVDAGSEAAAEILAAPFDPDWQSATQLATAAVLYDIVERDDRWDYFDQAVQAVRRLQPIWKVQALVRLPQDGQALAVQQFAVEVMAVAYGRKTREDVKFPAA